MELLNSHPSLKFKLTEEDPTDCSVNYLDMTIFRREDVLVTKWYSKPYSSGRLVHWFSGHSKDMVRSVALNQAHRMFKLTDPIYHEDIEFMVRDMLWKNSFPESIINNTVKQA